VVFKNQPLLGCMSQQPLSNEKSNFELSAKRAYA
jgi:hypothetical protein